MVGVVVTGSEDEVVSVTRCGTNPDVEGDTVGVDDSMGIVDVSIRIVGVSMEVVGVSIGIVGVSTGIVGVSTGIVDEYFALHLQYFLGGLVGAGNSGPSVGLLGGAIAMRTGLLRSCSASVVSVVSVAGFSPFLEEMSVVGLCPPGVLVVVACVVGK